MGKPEQAVLPISLGIRDLGKRAGARLLALTREVVRDSGKQESIARALGVSDALLSQALNSQRSFHLEWLPPLLPFDHGLKILKYLAWEAHCRVDPIDPFDNDDFRRAADDELREAGPLGETLRQRILERAQQVAAEKERAR